MQPLRQSPPPPPVSIFYDPPPVGGIGLMELNARKCKWPLWADDYSGEDKRYCGGQKEVEHPYCSCHMRTASASKVKKVSDAERRAAAKSMNKLLAARGLL